ncbi:MAG: GTP-binding protein [Promethearchaeota archaeon]
MPGYNIFISYVTQEKKRFQIDKIQQMLISLNEIDNCWYWEAHADEDFIRYMNEKIGKCHVFILTASELSAKSEPVILEWSAALNLRKQIIPIFFNREHIPPLLSSKIGVQLNPANWEQSLNNIKNEVLHRINILDRKKKEKNHQKIQTILKLNEIAQLLLEENDYSNSLKIINVDDSLIKKYNLVNEQLQIIKELKKRFIENFKLTLKNIVKVIQTKEVRANSIISEELEEIINLQKNFKEFHYYNQNELDEILKIYNELNKALIKKSKTPKKIKKAFKFKVMIIGDAAVGKTALVYRLIKNYFFSDYKLTVGVEITTKDILVDDQLATLTIWEPQSEERAAFIRSTFYMGAKGAIVVFDLSRFKTWENIKEWITELKNNAGNVPFILVGNKMDLMDERVIYKEECEKYAEENGTIYIETSAKDDINVEKIFKEITRIMISKENAKNI